MRKILLLLLCSVLIFCSCGKVDDNGVIIPNKDKDMTYVKDGKRITIYSLEEWNKFNFDGNFTDNCKNFLTMIINGTSAFAEFETVKLSEWEIIRDEDAYGYNLAFNFTVAESDLDSLPVGEYKTIVDDSLDCYIIFGGKAPTSINDGLSVISDNAKKVSKWINSTYSWSTPEYGKATKDMQLRALNYFIDSYGDGKKIESYKLSELYSEILGVEMDEDVFNELYAIENDELYVKRDTLNGVTDFAIIGDDTVGDITTVTVQFFADCNRFIKSDVIEYKIDSSGKLLECERLVFSEYEPFGVTNAFDEKS